MKETTTSAAVVPAAIVEEAWQAVGASFERFCLTAGIATLANMMEEDAARLCGPRYGRAEGKAGHRWGKTTGKVGFHGGKVEIERPRVRARDGGEVPLASWETAMSLHASVRKALRQAWELDDAEKAEKLIRNLARRLEHEAPGVSASILEGINEILTVTRDK